MSLGPRVKVRALVNHPPAEFQKDWAAAEDPSFDNVLAPTPRYFAASEVLNLWCSIACIVPVLAGGKERNRPEHPEICRCLEQ